MVKHQFIQAAIGCVLVIFLWIPMVFRDTQFLTVSDQSLTEGVIQDFFRRDTMDQTHSLLKSWYTHPRLYPDGLTIHYPIHLYSIGVVGSIIFGNAYTIMLPLLAIAGIVILAYFLSRSILKSLISTPEPALHTAVWLAMVTLLSSSWINGFRFELYYVLFTLAVLWTITRFYQSRSYIYIISAVTLVAFSMVLRQNYTLYGGFLLVLFWIQGFVFLPRTSWIWQIPLLIILPSIIISSYYTVLIRESGTVSYYSERGYPILDTQFFEPDYLKYEGLDQELQQSVDIPAIFQQMNRGFQTEYPSIVTMRKNGTSFRDMYRTLTRNAPVNIVFLAIMIIISGWIWFKKSPAMWYLFLAILIPYILTVTMYTINPRYVQSLTFLAILAIIPPIAYTWKRFATQFRAVIPLLLLLSFFQIVYLGHRNDIQTLSQTYWGTPSADAPNAWPVLTQWIQSNTNSDDRIFTQYQREVALHSEREALWDVRIWFVDNPENVLRYWDDLYQADYLLTKQSFVHSDDTYSNPMHIRSQSTLYKMLEISAEFEEVYTYQDFIVYKRVQ